ncbi:MAG: oligosaccharide flippase family protein [Candidatus Pacearchaeota archaeon]
MIKKIFSSDLAKGSLMLFIMFNIYNFLNFVFQFSMVRMLGPAKYGILAVLMTFLYAISIPSEVVQLIVSKYSSKFNVKKEYGKIKYVTSKIISKGLKLSVLVYVLLIPVFIILSYLLKIEFVLIIFVCLMILSIFLDPVFRGSMQGMKRFGALGINLISEALIKVAVAILLVYIGWGVYGAIGGIICGAIVSILIAFIPLRDIFSQKKEKADVSKLYDYSTPIVFSLIIILIFQSIDIILARIFFTDVVSGEYAVANLLGKVIFFGTIAISKAMFPIASENFESGKKTKSVFYKSLIAVFVLCGVALAILALFPELIVRILSGEQYSMTSGIIFNIGLAFTFISLSNIVLLYGISINKQIKAYHMLFFVISQVVVLWVFSGTIYLFSIGMVISGALLFVGSWFVVSKKRKEQGSLKHK